MQIDKKLTSWHIHDGQPLCVKKVLSGDQMDREG